MAAKTETVLTSSAHEPWLPVRGEATDALGRHLIEVERALPDEATFGKIVDSAVRIIRQCKPFDVVDGSRTGLVVGYVQSGKTISMAAVASLARDSGCRLVILLAGVTELLLKQTARDRLRPYLQNKPNPRSGWRLIDTLDSLDLVGNRKQELASAIEDYRRGDTPEERRRPFFITVMKNHAHLAALRDLLRSVNLKGIPALIIDDEADQAGLDNNAARAAAGKTTEPSTTHRRIVDIREALPNHTYLQYTATAQANLLISLANILSPAFAYVLEPGIGYTGGKTFFVDRPELVRTLPEEALFPIGSAPPDPPESLVRAMREFIVGVAIREAQKADRLASMLIHPSSRKNDQLVFQAFVRQIKDCWERNLRLGNDNELCQGEFAAFQEAYGDLVETYPDAPSFDVVSEEIKYVLRDTPIWLVNSEDGNEVDWHRSRSHILIGGDKLNRGFTVEGLTVTYMPRSPGAWNADTIQQRARFFGYKSKYLGLCRVYLHPDVANTYREYVHHEEDVRAQLKSHEGRPLKAWKRMFVLDADMKATRASVLSEPIDRTNGDSWFSQNYPHADAEVLKDNQALVDALKKKLQGLPLGSHSDSTMHRYAELPLQVVFTSFLADYGCVEGDAARWASTLLLVKELLSEDPDARCLLVWMNGGDDRQRAEGATVGRINQLFEGRRAKKSAEAYRGDKEVFHPDLTTVQLHMLTVKRKDSPAIEHVPAIAVHLPIGFTGGDIVVQHKAGQDDD